VLGAEKEKSLRHNTAFARRPPSVLVLVPRTRLEYNLCAWRLNGFLEKGDIIHGNNVKSPSTSM